jgi:hypothetical protein
VPLLVVPEHARCAERLDERHDADGIRSAVDEVTDEEEPIDAMLILSNVEKRMKLVEAAVNVPANK